MFKKLILLLSAVLLVSCGKDSVPKPRGDLRLEYPNADFDVAAEQRLAA